VKNCFVWSLLLAATAVAPALGGTTPVSVTQTWSRPAATTAVVYATLRNTGSAGDRLVGATSPAASSVGLHQSYTTKMSGSSMGGGMQMAGMPMNQSMVGMRDVSFIDVPAHGVVKLQPGGYHLMLDLRQASHAGDTILVRWHFAHAGWIATKVAVRAMQ
jgi:copper(I)-binding protein